MGNCKLLTKLCPIGPLWYVAVFFTFVLAFMDVLSLFEHSARFRNYITQDPDNVKCNGIGIGVVDEGHSAMHYRSPLTAEQCARSREAKTQALGRDDLIRDTDGQVFTDRHGIHSAIMHPADFNANIMHNFAPVYAPGSSVSQKTGYPWWGIGGIDGKTARQAYGLGVYLLRSKDGTKWEVVNRDKPIFTEYDHQYNAFYHSSFDGQNRIIYDEILDLFYLFTRANVGSRARSFQRSVSRDLECFTTLIPAKLDFYGGRCGEGDRAEQHYTHSVFQLNRLYPGVLFATPRRHLSYGRGTTSLMHSYDMGVSWRRTSGFAPWFDVNYSEMINSGLDDYYMDTFGCIVSTDRQSLHFFLTKARKELHIVQIPLLSGTKTPPFGKKKKYRPRVAALEIKKGEMTVFETRKIKFGGRCELFLDFDESAPLVAVLDKEGKDMDAYNLESSEVNLETGKVSWKIKGSDKAFRSLSWLPDTDVVKLRFKSNNLLLFAITCKTPKSQSRRREVDAYTESLLHNWNNRINRTHPAIYKTSTFNFLDYNQPYTFHEYWYGRPDRTIYMLDFHFIESTLKGSINFRLIKPGRLTKPNHIFPKVSGVIYPAIIDMGKESRYNYDSELVQSARHSCLSPSSKQQGYPLRLYLNMIPLSKIEGHGGNHAHDFFNNVVLYVANPQNLYDWFVPKETATRIREPFCVQLELKCPFGAFQPHGIFNIRTAHYFVVMYEKLIWVLLSILPMFIFLLCSWSRGNLVNNQYCAKSLNFMLVVSALAFTWSLLSIERKSGRLHLGIHPKKLK